MNKELFMKELKNKLKNLPKEEYDSAISFYEDYFNEAESEELALSKLSSPSKIANQLILECPEKEKSKVSFWIILLAILSAPIVLPLGFAGVAIVCALIIVILALIFSLFCFIASFALAEVMSIILTIPAFMYNVPTGLIFLGFSLLFIPVTYGIFVMSKWIMKKTIGLTKKCINKFIKKKGEKN